MKTDTGKLEKKSFFYKDFSNRTLIISDTKLPKYEDPFNLDVDVVNTRYVRNDESVIESYTNMGFEVIDNRLSQKSLKVTLGSYIMGSADFNPDSFIEFKSLVELKTKLNEKDLHFVNEQEIFKAVIVNSAKEALLEPAILGSYGFVSACTWSEDDTALLIDIEQN